jgi:hypothetical protein
MGLAAMTCCLPPHDLHAAGPPAKHVYGSLQAHYTLALPLLSGVRVHRGVYNT